MTAGLLVSMVMGLSSQEPGLGPDYRMAVFCYATYESVLGVERDGGAHPDLVESLGLSGLVSEIEFWEGRALALTPSGQDGRSLLQSFSTSHRLGLSFSNLRSGAESADQRMLNKIERCQRDQAMILADEADASEATDG